MKIGDSPSSITETQVNALLRQRSKNCFFPTEDRMLVLVVVLFSVQGK